MEKETMMLDVAQPLGGTLAIEDKWMPEFAGGISSLHNSLIHGFPYPFDTMSPPEIRVSVRENIIIVSFRMASRISSAKWLNQTVPELVRLLWLPQDWNSDNPEQISPKAIEKILALLLIILEPDSTPPVVVPTTRGGVQVEWHQNEVDLEIEATSSGKLEFFFSGLAGDKEGPVGDDPATLKQYTHYLKPSHTP